MQLGRLVASSAAALAVAGCAVVAVGMGRAQLERTAEHHRTTPTPSPTWRPAYLRDTDAPAAATVDLTQPPSHASTTAAAPPSTAHAAATTSPTAVKPASVPSARTSTAHTRRVARARHVSPPTHKASAKPPRRGGALPLHYSTGNATRVITVTAHSTSSTTATLQAWTKAPGGGWLRSGRAVTAHVGSQGLTTQPSESKSATPIGSFTLTQAFGYFSDPGTSLPYFKTNMNDYWISTAGPRYNTHQRCGSCGYNNGINERLATETPYYNYAVVIDYNTRNAPGGVHQGAGSAFFLHVYPSGSGPTAGCVAIPQNRLVSIMRWLTPSAHPRILIGVT